MTWLFAQKLPSKRIGDTFSLITFQVLIACISAVFMSVVVGRPYDLYMVFCRRIVEGFSANAGNCWISRLNESCTYILFHNITFCSFRKQLWIVKNWNAPSADLRHKKDNTSAVLAVTNSKTFVQAVIQPIHQHINFVANAVKTSVSWERWYLIERAWS